MSQDHLSW
uniref:Uncharacterized protein n=1 Tax=Rhizophora mucronata TaxID=61149 RepID=A0A2P2Q265_RHIMU